MIYKTNSGYGVNFNQLLTFTNGTSTFNGLTCVKNNNTLTITGTCTGTGVWILATITGLTVNNKIILWGNNFYSELGGYIAVSNGADFVRDTGNGGIGTVFNYTYGYFYIYTQNGKTYDITFRPQLSDLTQDFGAGNEPTTVSDFRAMYSDDYYDYTLSQWQWAKKGKITSYPTPVIENGTTLLPIENHIVGIIKPELPAGYVRLEYLESSGTQYIDTGYVPNANSKVIFDCAFMNTVSLGLRQGRYGGGQRLGIMQDTNVLEFSIGGYQQLNLDVYQQRHKFELDVPLGVGKLDGVVKATFAAITWTNQETLYLFARNVNNEAGGMGQIRNYQVQIYENDILVKNFIPCYRYSDGVEGMYDTVSKQLYTNSGTGTFTRGSVVNDTKIIYNYAKRELPAGFVRLDCIESTGTQWIDTGLNADSNLGIDIEVYEASGRFGAHKVINNVAYRHHTYSGSNRYGFNKDGYGEAYTVPSSYRLKVNYLKEKKLYFNESEYDISAEEFDCGVNYGLFRRLGDNETAWVGKVPYCKMTYNDTLARNYIPCYRFSDGIEGLYDKIAKRFDTNQGTGRFLRGKEIDSGNLLDLSKFVQGYPSDTAFDRTTKRTFTENTYVIGLASNNYYSTTSVKDVYINEQSLSLYGRSGYAIAFVLNLKKNQTYKLYCQKVSAQGVYILYYSSDGTFISSANLGSEVNESTFTTISDFGYALMNFVPTNETTATFSNISLHEVN